MISRLRSLFGLSRLRRAAIVMVAAPALSVAIFAFPFATQTADAFSCPSGSLCTWQNSGESGTQWNYSGNAGQPKGAWWYVGSGANDKISSMHNSTFSQAGWVAKNCPTDGQITWIGAGVTAPNLANNKWPNGTSMNDSISAWGITPSGSSAPGHGSRSAGGC